MRLARATLIVAASMLSVHCASEDSAPTDSTNRRPAPVSNVAPQQDGPTAIKLQRSLTPRYVQLGRIEGYGDSKTGELWIRPIADDQAVQKGSRRVAGQVQALGATPGYAGLDAKVLNDGVANSNPNDTIEFYTRGTATGNLAPSFLPATCVTRLPAGSTATEADFNAQGVGCAEQHLGNFTTLSFAHVYLDPDYYVSGNPNHLPWPSPFASNSVPTPSGNGVRNPPDAALGLWDFGPVGPRGSSTNLINMWLFFKNADSTNFKWTGSLVGEVFEDCTNSIDDDGDAVVNNGCGTFTGGAACFANADCVSNSCSASTITSRFGKGGDDLTDDVPGICLGAPTGLAYAQNPVTYMRSTAITPNTPSSGGGAVTSYSIAPALPAGLTLNTSTGVISGTPTVAAAPANYTVTAANSNGSTTVVLSLAVSDLPPTMLGYSQNPAVYTRYNTIASNLPSSSGGAVTSYSVSPALPGGLTLSASTGAISGTPTVLVAATPYTITASNSGGSTTATVTITVNEAPPSSLTYAHNPVTYTKGVAVAANAPAYNGGTVTSFTVNPPLPAGLTLSSTSGIVSGTPTVVAGNSSYLINASNSGGSTTAWLTITVNDAAPSSLAYAQNPAVHTKNTSVVSNLPSNAGGTIVAYSISPALPAGLSLSSSTGAITGTPTVLSPATSYTVTGTNTGGSTTSSLTITVNDVPPSALTYSANPATYMKGVAITPNVPSSGGGPIVTYSVSPALPSGLALNTSTGVISGTPTVSAYSASYTITGTNTGGSTNTAVIITVSDVAPSGLTYATNPAVYTKGTAITPNTPSSGGGVPLGYSVTPALPAGLSFDTLTGVVSGTPTALSPAASYTVTAQNPGGSTTASLSLTVNDVPPSGLSYSQNPVTYLRGLAITPNNPSVSGGPVVTYSTVLCSLPAGLSLDAATGVITGTPTTVGPVSCNIRASNSGGTTSVSVSFTIAEVAPTSLVYAYNPAAYTLGQAITTNTATYSGSAATFSVSPALPPGLTLNTSTGAISGTPTAVSVGSYVVTATNPAGSTTATLTITVDPGAIIGTAGAAAVGYDHSCAVVGENVLCWGGNLYGQLGDGTTANRSVATRVAGLAPGAQAVAVGLYHSCAIVNGGAWCWGNNADGELGNGTTVDSLTPVQVAGLSGATSISAGAYHTCAITNGRAVCWGANLNGQLGDGTAISKSAPVAVTGLASGVQAIAGGGYHSCAIVNGRAKCWGYNAYGQLGNTTYTSSNVAVDVTGLGSGVQKIATGEEHSCAVVNGAAKCWGTNHFGELGNNDVTYTKSNVPVQVVGLTSGVQDIVAGGENDYPSYTYGNHSCAIVNGAAKCWGCNTFGELGDNTGPLEKLVPVQVTGLGSGVQALAAGSGGLHACAIVNGALKCWGDNLYGGIGNGTANNNAYTPVQAAALTKGIQGVASGDEHQCAVINGGAWCWGDNAYGQLGNGTTTDGYTAAPVSGLTSGVQSIVAGGSQTCAVVNGAAMCWGQNNYGQLGDGTLTQSSLPVPVSGLTSGVQSMTAGYNHGCAVVNGSAQCWGNNTYGRLGNNATATSNVPVQVSGLAAGVQAMTGGSSHTCAIVDGSAACWGYNGSGQLGNGTSTTSLVPSPVNGLASGVQSLVAGGSHTCAVVNGAVLCWGTDSYGQLGDGTGSSTPLVPNQALVLTTDAQALFSGDGHSCGVKNGAAYCWGWNIHGQLGDSTNTDKPSPVAVVGLGSGVQLTASGGIGNSSTMLVGGRLKAWGSDGNWKLGDGGSAVSSSTPVNVTQTW